MVGGEERVLHSEALTIRLLEGSDHLVCVLGTEQYP